MFDYMKYQLTIGCKILKVLTVKRYGTDITSRYGTQYHLTIKPLTKTHLNAYHYSNVFMKQKIYIHIIYKLLLTYINYY